MNEHDLDIKELVQAVRQELESIDTQRIAANRPALFELAGLELELHFAVIRDAKNQAKLDLKVVSVGGDRTYRTEEIQKVTVRFDVSAEARERHVAGSRAHGDSTADTPVDVAPLAPPA